LVEFVAMHHLPERRVLRDLVADDDQRQARWSARPGAPERVDHPLDVRVRLDVST